MKDAKTVRRHKGDIMSPAKRSALMSRIKGKNTGPERILATALTAQGLSWEAHLRDVPGRPDFVFREKRIVIFVDGDFWHGWRFSRWRDKLSVKWESKIEQNRIRDRRNCAKLRRQGWTIVRVWEHQIERDLQGCISRISRLFYRSPGEAGTLNLLNDRPMPNELQPAQARRTSRKNFSS